MNKSASLDISQLLAIFVAQSNDGYMILDANDEVLYVNQFFAEALLETNPQEIVGKTFVDYMREAFKENRGPLIETDNIESWLKDTQYSRWQENFRSFEIELHDGRWFLITEQVIGSLFLFVHATEVSRTKALEIELRHTQSQLLEHAYVDELTNIPNRRKFIERTTEEINKAQRNNNSISLFIFDIDHFKAINDKYGHQAGDEALKALCRLVTSQLRDYDIFARIGGEEFAIVFSDSDNDNLATIERIRASIEQAGFKHKDNHFQFTASFGGATLQADEKLDSLVSRADKNLYEAKNKGRNRTIFSK